MFNWSIQNSPSTSVDQLTQQWFWYRVGSSGPESAINTISAPTITTPNASTLYTSYTDSLGRFNLSVKYSLVGGATLSGTSDITEQITINNTSGAPLPFHFYQYSDFDMGGTAEGDSVTLSKNGLTSRFNQSDQADGANIVETVITPNADHGEAGFFPVLLNKLNDGSPTTLNDSLTAGPGDVDWGFEWDPIIPTGGSYIISKDKHIDIPVVPEPSLAVMLPGMFAFLLRRRAAVS
jgi:hypothetical protein